MWCHSGRLHKSVFEDIWCFELLFYFSISGIVRCVFFSSHSSYFNCAYWYYLIYVSSLNWFWPYWTQRANSSILPPINWSVSQSNSGISVYSYVGKELCYVMWPVVLLFRCTNFSAFLQLSHLGFKCRLLAGFSSTYCLQNSFSVCILPSSPFVVVCSPWAARLSNSLGIMPYGRDLYLSFPSAAVHNPMHKTFSCTCAGVAALWLWVWVWAIDS